MGLQNFSTSNDLHYNTILWYLSTYIHTGLPAVPLTSTRSMGSDSSYWLNILLIIGIFVMVYQKIANPRRLYRSDHLALLWTSLAAQTAFFFYIGVGKKGLVN